MFIGQSEIKELKAIASNLAEQVLDGTYSINEAAFEVLPFEFTLDPAALKYVVERLQILTKLEVEY